MSHSPQMPLHWDYLILTASNDRQAAAYRTELERRFDAGHLARVGAVLVVADLEGKRIGSGGSTLQCLLEVVKRERAKPGLDACPVEQLLSHLRVLIIHAGGDSRRLPAYGPCGKIFVPVPGESQGAFGMTLFDRLAPAFLDLPPGAHGAGQIVVTAGDALNRFDGAAIRFDSPGITALGCYAAPEEAARHGVFCVDDKQAIRLFLQKPSIEEQLEYGATNRFGKTPLDIGIMSFDAAAGARMLAAFDGMLDRILELGLDLYCEICCAMGSEATLEHYIRSAQSSGSKWNAAQLAQVFPALRAIPFQARVVSQCSFLHFGSTRQLVASGLALAMQDSGAAPTVTTLSLDNQMGPDGAIAGSDSWVEGCLLDAPLLLAGRNVVVGVDVDEQLALHRGACLDVVKGAEGYFIRCYGVDDTFKHSVDKGGTFCGIALAEWLAKAGVKADDVWPADVAPAARSLWNARVFPLAAGATAYRDWLWMFDPGRATAEQKRAFASARRFSAAEIATLADQDDFHERRARIRAEAVRENLPRLFEDASAFSSADLAFAFAHSPNAEALRGYALALVDEHAGEGAEYAWCRIAHTLGDATGDTALCTAARQRLDGAIERRSLPPRGVPKNMLRRGETIWGRGPALVEFAGGYTAMLPNADQYGSAVAAVPLDLNSRPAVQCFCRRIDAPVIRMASIGDGAAETIETVEQLHGRGAFAAMKAALVAAGFAPAGAKLAETLASFGGGIELTTVEAVPSGADDPRALAAVVLAVLERLTGARLTQQLLPHPDLCFTPALVRGGAKLITGERARFFPSALIDPASNATLLYAVGRLPAPAHTLRARYLSRDRWMMAALEEQRAAALCIADTLSRQDALAFGRMLDAAWSISQRLAPHPEAAALRATLMSSLRPRLLGACGPGPGGLMLLVARSCEAAASIRAELEAAPLTEAARFLDFSVNRRGVEVTSF